MECLEGRLGLAQARPSTSLASPVPKQVDPAVPAFSGSGSSGRSRGR